MQRSADITVKGWGTVPPWISTQTNSMHTPNANMSLSNSCLIFGKTVIFCLLLFLILFALFPHATPLAFICVLVAACVIQLTTRICHSVQEQANENEHFADNRQRDIVRPARYVLIESPSGERTQIGQRFQGSFPGFSFDFDTIKYMHRGEV